MSDTVFKYTLAAWDAISVLHVVRTNDLITLSQMMREMFEEDDNVIRIEITYEGE